MVTVPLGFRFSPTDEQLIQYFLPMKVRGETLDCDTIKDCDIYGDKEPWKIFDIHAKQDFYVFVKLNKRTVNGTMKKRTAGCGNWDAQYTNKIKDAQGRVIGLNKMLRFQVPEHLRSVADGNGRWIMHEYSIGPNDDEVICKITNKDAGKQMKIHERKRSQENKLERNQQAKIICMPEYEHQNFQQWTYQLENIDIKIDLDQLLNF